MTRLFSFLVDFFRKIDTRFLIFIIVSIFVIIVRYLQSLPDVSVGEMVKLSGKVSSEPTNYEFSQGINLRGYRMYLPSYPRVYYGDYIEVVGVVSEDNILDDPQLLGHTVNEGPLYKFRHKLLDFYNHTLPTPHSSLVSGMVLGTKANMDVDFWDDLKSTGTAHVVVASGMNVTLVGGFLVSTLVLFVRRKRAIIIALIGIWFYAVLVGFDAPIIRASLMASIALGAQVLGRVGIAWRALLLSAIFMLLLQPQWLTDLGFILSFIATASLMAFQKPIENKLFRLPQVIKVDLSTSLAAQIGVAPVLLFAFGSFNPLAPLINAIVLWTVAPITIVAAISGMIGLVFESIGRVALLLVYPLTSWFVAVVEIFA